MSPVAASGDPMPAASMQAMGPGDRRLDGSGTEPAASTPGHANASGTTKAAGTAHAAGTGAGVGASELSEELLRVALEDLHRRRQELQQEIRELESRRDQITTEIHSSFSGQSDALARRLKGFQDYLVGALQDLVVSAEQMELVVPPVVVQPSPLDLARPESEPAPAAVVAGGPFAEDEALIRDRLERQQGQPDFYADPWILRRSLDGAGAILLQNWFFDQGGRGAQASTGSRNRNGLIAAAAIAILGELYGDRFQTLVLAGTPERLGEWRRSLQDCLGLSREDFGPNSGIVLFERAEALIERADRLEERGELPFIVIDAGEEAVAVAILQFPLWLAFAAGPEEIALDEDPY